MEAGASLTRPYPLHLAIDPLAREEEGGSSRPTIYPTEEPLRPSAVTGRMETGSGEIQRWLYLASPQ